jgi:hypothetical protein
MLFTVCDRNAMRAFGMQDRRHERIIVEIVGLDLRSVRNVQRAILRINAEKIPAAFAANSDLLQEVKMSRILCANVRAKYEECDRAHYKGAGRKSEMFNHGVIEKTSSANDSD